MKQVVIVDYGMGNIYSISSAIEYLGLSSRLSSDHDVIAGADFLIMPGVGSFNLAMQRIRGLGLIDALHDAVIEKKIPILGICLGMQLLAKSGTEDGDTEGLGFIDGVVERFSPVGGRVKIPHVGFAPTRIVAPASPLLRGLPEEVDFYYTHSYRMVCAPNSLLATGENGETFAAAVGKGNIYGTQFHPELSQTNGLMLLKNFFNECG
jgi:glutamine amidotransferase